MHLALRNALSGAVWEGADFNEDATLEAVRKLLQSKYCTNKHRIEVLIAGGLPQKRLAYMGTLKELGYKDSDAVEFVIVKDLKVRTLGKH